MPLELVDTLLGGIKLYRLGRHHDQRGFFEEVWRADLPIVEGQDWSFVQDNHSKSNTHVIRGLHAQRGMGKYLMVVSGAIQLVELDIRVGSTTFGQHTSFTLTEESAQAVWIPPGFANGFCALADNTHVMYKCTAFFDAASELSIHPLDGSLAIPWQTGTPILSARDATAPTWDKVREQLVRDAW